MANKRKREQRQIRVKESGGQIKKKRAALNKRRREQRQIRAEESGAK